jgi:uncharacterized protein
MIVNVGALEKGCEKRISLTQDVCVSVKNRDEKVFSVKFDGSVFNAGGKYTVKGNVSTIAQLVCDRCLSEFEREINFDIDEVFVRNESSDNVEAYLFSGSEIDLNDAVVSGILLNLPMKSLCRENCKGLCFKCGCNLNVSECGCDRGYVNPYFEDIKSFFDDKEV